MAHRRHGPAKVPALQLPPDGPALNALDRLWRARKDGLAWRQCPTRDAPQDDVGQVLQAQDAATRHARTSDAQRLEAIPALTSSQSHIRRPRTHEH